MPKSRFLLTALLMAFCAVNRASLFGTSYAEQDRTPGSAPTSTHIIRGRVTSAENARPLRGAIVRATTSSGAAVRSVVCDADGRYQFVDLPPGTYYVRVSLPGRPQVTYGQRTYGEPGKLLDLRISEKLEKIDVALPRGAAIAGLAVDEFGVPVVGASVRALQTRFDGGARKLTQAASSSQTNDLGEFRVFGLAPGSYLISVVVRAPFEDIQAVDSAYPPTYFPGSANVSGAQPITVSQGDTVSGIVIQLAPVTAVRLSGTAVDAAGRPFPGGFVNVAARSPLGTLAMAAGPISPSGTFTISGVAPGDYLVRADSSTPGPDGHVQVAVGSVTVLGKAPVSGLRLEAERWGTVRGRIVLTDKSVPIDVSAMTVMVERLAGDDPFEGIWKDGSIKADATFAIEAPPGRLHLRPARIPQGWTISAIRRNGEDVTDSGFDLDSGKLADDVEIELTNRPPVLTAQIERTLGATPGELVTVLVFAQQESRWVWNSRYFASVPAEVPGDVAIRSLPPGDYFIVAAQSVPTALWRNPDFLRHVSGEATKVTLTAGDRKTVPLKVVAHRFDFAR